MKEVYSTSSLSDADVVKSILEANGIKCFLQDKNIATSYPPVTFSTGIKIFVSDKDFELAGMILKDYLDNK